ncbi:velvet factor-domain-containing protein [Podospora fimiseda]|uniref:Velvet factor-domain-containing protein n=1 Tax=Podospora fimiseda TaxID=252190 RepID=A0AAN7BNC6_9PEZI|nr:velvet factor-domain-containing protein [Podospora fimiseda]
MGTQVISSAGHGIIPAIEAASDPNPGQIISRDTKGGRTLWYCLKVIQQPERARACGAGPKSSADRRPVDPPPVVELRIFEGKTWEQAQDKDITFLYSANFFLYATLEHARVMAHGRVQTPAANQPPILTGMPVSGMAYLDRPTEAGYFLFPDLSVRHEGRYRLTFNLYEETKEDKDKDRLAEDSPQSAPGTSPATGGSFDFRMEVKSQDFIVYSAKKFPGLAESTQLSRVVAEQGCRVRIRRDVRMRRRGDPKGNNGGDYENNAEDEFSHAARRPSRRTATPDTRNDFNNRARSMSGSVERPPYSADAQRRPSAADYPPQYPSQGQPSGGHLQFLGGGSNSQYPAQPPSVPASPAYPPQGRHGAPYQPQSSYPAPPPPPSQPSYTSERPSTQPYAPINPAPRRESMLRPTSSSVMLPPLTGLTSYPPAQQQKGHMLPPNSREPLPLAPLQINHSQPANIQNQLPSLTMPSPTALAAANRPMAFSGSLNPRDRQPPASVAGTKRAHADTFRQDAEPPRFQNGERDRGSSEDPDEVANMRYRRANGEVKNYPQAD